MRFYLIMEVYCDEGAQFDGLVCQLKLWVADELSLSEQVSTFLPAVVSGFLQG
jgi:tRNA U34 5-methylaminomethyl-2-thiouridine-forming methyltransferase MnmC